MKTSHFQLSPCNLLLRSFLHELISDNIIIEAIRIADTSLIFHEDGLAKISHPTARALLFCVGLAEATGTRVGDADPRPPSGRRSIFGVRHKRRRAL